MKKEEQGHSPPDKKLCQYFPAFDFFADKLNISPPAQALYFQLLRRINRERWKMPLAITETELLQALHISHRTFIATRQELRDKGLITYHSARPLPCEYYLQDIYSKLQQEKANEKRKENDRKLREIKQQFQQNEENKP